MSRKSNQILVREDHALPRTKAGISSLVREILDAEGACERIIIEQSQPVRVWRWKEPDPMEESSVGLDGALRNAEMLEYVNPNEDTTPAEVVMHMMHVLSSEGAHPVCWVIGPSKAMVVAWLQVSELDLPGDMKGLMNVPFKHLESLPPETLILAGSPMIEGDIRDISVAVKATMEFRRSRNVEVDNGDAHRVGDHSDRDGSPDGEVEGDPGELGGESWAPSRFLRERLNRSGTVR